MEPKRFVFCDPQKGTELDSIIQDTLLRAVEDKLSKLADVEQIVVGMYDKKGVNTTAVTYTLKDQTSIDYEVKVEEIEYREEIAGDS